MTEKRIQVSFFHNFPILSRLSVLLFFSGLLVSLSGNEFNNIEMLSQSTVTEVINQVDKIEAETRKHIPAQVSMLLQSPDLLQTGRRSRAELTAEDGTITRVGSNTVFSFNPQGREIHLEKGSMLFHSREGKGGGRIVTQSATAAVLGTTIIVVATKDGGFKVLVLEGKAEVAFNNGLKSDLKAGQMTFVMPGPGGQGLQGPVVNFDLKRQLGGSNLVKGFSRPLDSKSKMESAVKDQQKAIGRSRYTTTNFLIFDAGSDDQVNGIEAGGPDADDFLEGDFTAAQQASLRQSITITDSNLPSAHVFTQPFLVPASENEFLNIESDTLLTGLLAYDIHLNTDNIDFSPWAGMDGFNMIADAALYINGDITFSGLDNIPLLRLFSPSIFLADGADISVAFDSLSLTTFYLDTENGIHLSGGSMTNNTGGIILQSHLGDLGLTNTVLTAGNRLGHQTAIPSSINLDIKTGSANLTGSTLDAQGSGIAAYADSLTIGLSLLSSEQNIWMDAADFISFDNSGLYTTDSTGILQLTANNQVSLSQTEISGFMAVNSGARTIVLNNINFEAGTQVNLVCETGMLAPSPNTGQNAVSGYVNFINNVTYDNNPAQDYVSVASGGSGAAATNIDITTPGP